MFLVENLTFSYARGRENTLSNFSLSLEKGKVYGLLGKNGAGKSTLLYLMSGLLTPKSGRVLYHGVDVRRRLPLTLQDMFIVPEEFELPSVSLQSYVKLNAPFYPRFSREQMLDYCRELGVSATQRLHSLSMGQRKKAYIAFALACNVRMLLLDEPTNGLDIPSKSAFRRLLAGYVDDERMALISTHQVADVEQLLDNIVILDEQGVALSATTSDICRKLRFGVKRDGDEVLYSEQTIAGEMVVARNIGEEDSSLNIELLFNAVTANRKAVSLIFNR